MADFKDSATALLLRSPFFGTLLMKMRHEERDTLNPPTLAVSQSTLYYHPAFMAQLTAGEAVFAIAHEVMHAAWMHLPRMHAYMECGIGPDGKAYDHKLMNIACDFAVNDALRETQVGEIPRPEVIKPYLDPKRYPYTMTPEEIYCKLKQDNPKTGGHPHGGDGGGGGQLMDGHMPGPIEPGPDEADGRGPAAPITAADVIQAANVAKLTQGKLPAGIDRLIGELQKPKVSPWKRLLKFISSALSGYDTMTWRRLNRKLIVRGVGVPSTIGYGCGTIGVVVDTSGSIGNEMLRWFGGHMAAIMEDAKPKLVKIYWTDAKVHRVDDAKRPIDLRRILSKKVPGGGGTDMPAGVRAAEADKCDAIVVLTDGYTDFCGSKKPLIWAITESGPKLPANCGQYVNIAMA